MRQPLGFSLKPINIIFSEKQYREFFISILVFVAEAFKAFVASCLQIGFQNMAYLPGYSNIKLPSFVYSKYHQDCLKIVTLNRLEIHRK